MIAPLFQNDTELRGRPSIESYGCLFRSLVELAESHVSRALTARENLILYDWLLEQGYLMDSEGQRSWVMSHSGVINGALFYLNGKQDAEYRCRMDFEGQGKDFGSMAGCNYFIGQARIEGWNISHFFHCDSRGDRVWDPYWPAKPVEKLISLRGYVIGGES